MENVVLHVLNTSQFSGAENVVCQIIKMYHNDSNYKMVYCSLDGQIRSVLENERIEFAPIKKMNICELKKVINKVKPTIIHAHDMRASFFVAISCGKIPFVCHVHNNGFDSRKINLKVLLFNYATKKARHIFWVSKAAKEGYYFKNRIEEKSSVLYNVVNAEEIYRKASTNICKKYYDAIFLGRLSYEKNPLRLIEIISDIVKTNPTVKVAIVGSGPLEDDVNKKVMELGLSRNVDMLGFQNNPYPFLKKSKLMVMTSLWEGLPMCALEAISLGIPIVSTPTDGLCELIIEGETGFLSNNNEELANRIISICNNENLQRKMSTATLEQAGKILNLKKYKKDLSVYYE